MNHPELQQKTFLVLLIAVSLAFFWVLLPFYGAVFWGTVLAILFAPLYRRFAARMPKRRNLAAILTLAIVLFIVILPVTFIATALAQEVTQLYVQVRSGQIDAGALFQQVVGALPPWLGNVLDRFDLLNLESLRQRLSTGATEASQHIAGQVLNIGQNTFQFLISFGIMLYLLFFLLRDGAMLAARIRDAIPLSTHHKRHLFSKFTTVIRATVKGNIAVAGAQGLLGGLMFWFLGIQGALLWGALMTFLSLLPAVGAGLVWAPVALYFLAAGPVWKGVTLILFGVLVIGLVDNLLRPILVGKDTQMPDYVVLISTLGGIAVFGLNGFVIGPAVAALFIAAWDLFSETPEVHPPSD
ncbi:AI-2E family transporter [Noviherbaspirillum pedocola]|uniref:AI-2E family transporter n=1 Tax=Noviherbaspirillum pedocola TaxID=2801341 RepID=A0A934W7M0_9BURK|nr:AI-2E family transporter [Noviherbaspirillum pedocola]MBK4736540.1 AI-2E family transporter [Noviherbaspirillum pedocola]